MWLLLPCRARAMLQLQELRLEPGKGKDVHIMVRYMHNC
jgi:hypothetical protein